MAIRTPREYIESLKDDRVVYCMGERVGDVTEHPILRICINWMATDYVVENAPRYQGLVTERDEERDLIPFVLTPQRSYLKKTIQERVKS